MNKTHGLGLASALKPDIIQPMSKEAAMKVIDNPSVMPVKANAVPLRPPQPSASDQGCSQNRRDTVTLSKTAETMATAAKRVKAMPNVDMTKVDRVKAMLQNGTYKVDPEKTASNMLAESLLKD